MLSIVSNPAKKVNTDLCFPRPAKTGRQKAYRVNCSR